MEEEEEVGLLRAEPEGRRCLSVHGAESLSHWLGLEAVLNKQNVKRKSLDSGRYRNHQTEGTLIRHEYSRHAGGKRECKTKPI